MITGTILGQKFTFQTSPTVFSPQKIDEGTRFLLENINITDVKRILDIGCGYGAIGIVVAKTNPESQIVMIDKNPEALRLCKENVKLNNLQNCRVLTTSAVNTISKFNLALSNLPWHQNKTAVPEIISLAFDRLENGGKFFAVTNSQFLTEDLINTNFGNVMMIRQWPPYKILKAEKK